MITRVLRHDGSVEHDCIEQGCDVSWDGCDIATGKRVEGHTGIARPFERVDETTVKLPREG